MESKKVNVTFNGRVVGFAKVDLDFDIAEFELEPGEMEFIFPGYNPAEGLSIAPAEEVDLSAVYYKNRPKGTFDA